MIFAIVLDVITFIPRLIAAPFRVVYNQKNQKEHPLVHLINNNPKSTSALEAGLVKIGVKCENVNIQLDTHLNVRTAKQFLVNGYVEVTIKKLYNIEAKSRLEFNKRSATYMEIEGEWDAQSASEGPCYQFPNGF